MEWRDRRGKIDIQTIVFLIMGTVTAGLFGWWRLDAIRTKRSTNQVAFATIVLGVSVIAFTVLIGGWTILFFLSFGIGFWIRYRRRD